MNDGQSSYARDFVAYLKAAVSSRRTNNNVSRGKSKKKSRKSKESKDILPDNNSVPKEKVQPSNWGYMEPIRAIFEALFDIVKPLVGESVLYALLALLILAACYRFGLFSRASDSGHNIGRNSYVQTPGRLVAYDEMWRNEESELWEWLETRLGSDGFGDLSKLGSQRKVYMDKLKDSRMGDREVEAAIRVTQDKLDLLRGLMEKKKQQQQHRAHG